MRRTRDAIKQHIINASIFKSEIHVSLRNSLVTDQAVSFRLMATIPTESERPKVGNQASSLISKQSDNKIIYKMALNYIKAEIDRPLKLCVKYRSTLANAQCPT